MLELKPWTLPLIVAAIVVPIVAGLAVGGPGLAVALAAVIALVVVVTAARARPGGPIETASGHDGARHVLVVLSHELDDRAAIDRVKAEGGFADTSGDAKVLVLAPAKTGLLDHWATDVGPARKEAQRKLDVSVESLGRAGVSAASTLGDEKVVRAVEDRLRSFPADEVILVTGDSEEDPEGERAAEELTERLRQPLRRIQV